MNSKPISKAAARLGIDHPIVQGPFGGGLSTVELAATVSGLGGLGSYGAHGLAPERIGEVAAAIRARTNAPFAMNLLVSDHDRDDLALTREVFDRVFALFEPWYHELGVDKPEMPERYHAERALGAEAAQIGTAFLACKESGTHEVHRQRLFGPDARKTTPTRSFTGRLARGLSNRWTEQMGQRPERLPPFPVQGWFVSKLRPAAIAAGRDDLVSLWSGQIAPNLRHGHAADLMQALIAD